MTTMSQIAEHCNTAANMTNGILPAATFPAAWAVQVAKLLNRHHATKWNQSTTQTAAVMPHQNDIPGLL